MTNKTPIGPAAYPQGPARKASMKHYIHPAVLAGRKRRNGELLRYAIRALNAIPVKREVLPNGAKIWTWKA